MPKKILTGNRGYHTINKKTPSIGEYNGPKQHHLILTAEDNEGNVFGHLLSRDFKHPKVNKTEINKLSRELRDIDRTNWYLGANQDKKPISLDHIIADDTGSIPFDKKTEASSIAIKLPKEYLNESRPNWGFSIDRNNKLQEEIVNSYNKNGDNVEIPYFTPETGKYSTIEIIPKPIGWFKPEDYTQHKPNFIAEEVLSIIKNDQGDFGN